MTQYLLTFHRFFTEFSLFLWLWRFCLIWQRNSFPYLNQALNLENKRYYRVEAHILGERINSSIWMCLPLKWLKVSMWQFTSIYSCLLYSKSMEWKKFAIFRGACIRMVWTTYGVDLFHSLPCRLLLE